MQRLNTMSFQEHWLHLCTWSVNVSLLRLHLQPVRRRMLFFLFFSFLRELQHTNATLLYTCRISVLSESETKQIRSFSQRLSRSGRLIDLRDWKRFPVMRGGYKQTVISEGNS
jgi:hypothetical protein